MIIYFNNVWDYEKTAAAVLEVGRLEQSPNDHTFWYFTCWRVYLSTSTYPCLSANPEFLINYGGLIGGTIWRKSYGFFMIYLVSRFSKIAYLSVI